MTDATSATGRPYHGTTGADNNGDGSNADRPVIDGHVIGRNARRGGALYDLSLFIERDFPAMLPRFERLYARKYPPDAYRNEVKAMVRALQQRYGVTRREDAEDKSEAEPAKEETQVGFRW